MSFESDIYLVDEDRGPVVVCIAREGEISETLTVQVSTSELEPLEAKGGKLSYNHCACVTAVLR